MLPLSPALSNSSSASSFSRYTPDNSDTSCQAPSSAVSTSTPPLLFSVYPSLTLSSSSLGLLHLVWTFLITMLHSRYINMGHLTSSTNHKRRIRLAYALSGHVWPPFPFNLASRAFYDDRRLKTSQGDSSPVDVSHCLFIFHWSIIPPGRRVYLRRPVPSLF